MENDCRHSITLEKFHETSRNPSYFLRQVPHHHIRKTRWKLPRKMRDSCGVSYCPARGRFMNASSRQDADRHAVACILTSELGGFDRTCSKEPFERCSTDYIIQSILTRSLTPINHPYDSVDGGRISEFKTFGYPVTRRSNLNEPLYVYNLSWHNPPRLRKVDSSRARAIVDLDTPNNECF
jgi:hypothetical protein